MKSENSFTLVELLIVIGILAILTAAVVIILNPAELLKQSRDGARISDLNSIDAALSLLTTQTLDIYLGVPAIVYISLPDASSTCGSYALPPLSSGYAYHCATEENLRKIDGNGWLPVNFNTSLAGSLPALPVDPLNISEGNFYYSYSMGGSWHLRSSLESEKYLVRASEDGGTSANSYEKGTNMSLLPVTEGWVKVPGNASYGTSDFWAMKYEAKCVSTAVPGTGLTNPNSGYNTYGNNVTQCISANGRGIASVSSGYPIAYISHTQAVSYCQSIGAHLLTNDEWMTIARNAEQVSENWTSGSVGTGQIYIGHVDAAPNLALEASGDANPYSGTGDASSSSQRRTHTLSNGSIIWDLSGNMAEHVQRSTNNVGDATTVIYQPACNTGTNWQYCQFNNLVSPYVSSWTSDMSYEMMGPSNTSWNTAQGVGTVYTWPLGGQNMNEVFIRGGHWGRSTNAGIFSFTPGAGTKVGSSGYYVGFRCAR